MPRPCRAHAAPKPRPCRAHAVPLPCHAPKGLECVFPIWFTQCVRVWFTLAMPRPRHVPTMPFFSRPRHSTAVSRRPCCGDIVKDCSKGEPSITTLIALYITVLSGVFNTRTIQPVFLGAKSLALQWWLGSVTALPAWLEHGMGAA